MIEELRSKHGSMKPAAVSASVRPRNVEGSYMPCFLCGEGFGRSLSAVNDIPLFRTSHQVGHILAALYSADRMELVNERFIAFHVSGGTTDCLYCEPDAGDVIKITEVGTSIDRTGVMLGLQFPCGPELEKLAMKADKSYKVKAVLKDSSCCLSGVENKCRDMLNKGEKPENIAKFCLDTICVTVAAMTDKAIEKYGRLPLVFAGGVMSDKLIRDRIISLYNDASFAEPQFSCDNASGVAIYGYLKYTGEK